MSFDTLSHLVLGGCTLLIVYRLMVHAEKRSLLPPGPPGDPIIGNLRSMPTENFQDQFHEWSQAYGDVMHLALPGQHMIVLDSDEASLDLLEKRSSLYSDRPRIVVYPLMGWVKVLSLMRYGEEWRYHRKLLHSHLTETASRAYEHIQLRNAYNLAQGLLENNGDFDQLLGRFSTAVIIEVAYGHQVGNTEDDRYIKLAAAGGSALSAGGPAGGTVVDLFPILQYFPSWFPGTYYVNVARRFKDSVNQFYRIPFQETLKAISEGNAAESFLSRCIAELGGVLSETDEDTLRGASAQLYVAGAETTWSTLSTFMLAMVLYPETQQLAQEEVDRVVGRDRLPLFKDRKSLPYINAVVEETLRFVPDFSIPTTTHLRLPVLTRGKDGTRLFRLVLSISLLKWLHQLTPSLYFNTKGLPHRATHHDTYRGMFIPKGSTIFANAMGISRNADAYKNPEVFNPMRFLPKSQGGNDEPKFSAAFGYGRRICPGRHLATASLFITIATIVSTMKISKAKDSSGEEITPEEEYITGITSRPKPFLCTISPRGANTKNLVDEIIHAVE